MIPKSYMCFFTHFSRSIYYVPCRSVNAPPPRIFCRACYKISCGLFFQQLKQFTPWAAPFKAHMCILHEKMRFEGLIPFVFFSILLVIKHNICGNANFSCSLQANSITHLVQTFLHLKGTNLTSQHFK